MVPPREGYQILKNVVNATQMPEVSPRLQQKIQKSLRNPIDYRLERSNLPPQKIPFLDREPNKELKQRNSGAIIDATFSGFLRASTPELVLALRLHTDNFSG
ncbi:hypothetical protein Ddc_12322 [Ditylenchus destructor]|nr:hypothetical protein Ddc_12322 [Ditylenchus destructor]